MKVNYLGGKGQERMIKNGWTIKLVKFDETSDQLYERLSQRYSKVKVYYNTTRVRGYHKYFAMVKDRIYC